MRFADILDVAGDLVLFGAEGQLGLSVLRLRACCEPFLVLDGGDFAIAGDGCEQDGDERFRDRPSLRRARRFRGEQA